jgi:stress-induced morphogen
MHRTDVTVAPRDANLAGRYAVAVADLPHIERLLEEALPGSDVRVEDLAGGDHLHARVRAPQFTGLSLIDQHRLVYAPVQHLLDDGTIHALRITTEAPA